MDSDLEARLRRAFTQMKLSDADQRAVERLAWSPGRWRNSAMGRFETKRRWSRLIVLPVALGLMLGAGVVALATQTVNLPIGLHYNPISRSYAPSMHPSSTVTCPSPMAMGINGLDGRINFHMATLNSPQAQLTGSLFQGSCSSDPNKGGYAILNYTFNGTPIQLDEGLSRSSGSVTEQIKGSPPVAGAGSPYWKVMTISGSQYSVELRSSANGGEPTVMGSSWQTGDTTVNLTVGRKGAAPPDKGAESGMPLNVFEELVSSIG